MEPVPRPLRLTRRTRLTQWRRRQRVHGPLFDGVIALLLMVYAIGSLFAVEQGRTMHKRPGTIAIGVVVIALAPAVLRRRTPLPVLVWATSGVLLLVALDYQVSGFVQALLVVTYSLGAYGTPRDRTAGLAWIGAALLYARFEPHGLDNGGLGLNTALFLAAYLFGSTIRNRRLYTQQVEERAALAERERDEEAKRAVAEERLRIARELHDVVAHSIGVIAVQAGVGAHVIDNDPAEAKRSLEAISHTSRSTLAEIRRLLAVLREDDGAEYAPAPGLGDLPHLAQEVEAAGVHVDVQYDGVRGELPPGVDFTAYRIVQEALTNVLKHAGTPVHADVRIGYEPVALRIEISDDGRGVNGRSPGTGHGLAGMRERVAVYGGSFTAGPRAGGGFAVSVRLPYGEVE